eukprot:Skav234869  [mRNA]  locus=scaffold840:301220:307135:+ [translate_table: standard]
MTSVARMMLSGSHVDGGEEQLTLGRHVYLVLSLDGVPQHLQDTLELSVGGAGRIWQAAVLGKLLLQFLALVNQQGGITSIIHKLIASIGTWHCHHLLSAPPVLRQSLTLPCKDSGGASLGNGRGSMILGAEDVA